MSKINILPAKVYNRIAAGEVVDRPYSVVKELVENAVDAGATEITVYLERGGKQLVRVVDNGSGIERDDLHAAFMPHATSKISKAEDLHNITTLGFRGEAVASIASVSKMTITSKTENGKCYSLSSDGGELGEITESAGEKGTDVRVEMLFFNTPVRLGFLKSDKAEEADVTTFVTRFILCRSDIAFTYYVNDKKVLQSFGGGDEEAFVNVYGVSTLERCYKIDAERNGVRVRGFIGDQNFFKANKSYQSVFLNGRYIVNATVAAALANAYASYAMKRQYPFYVLYIQVPTETVDVNVHPNKSDVRFLDNGVIYANLKSIVSSVLDGNAKALDYVVQENAPQPVQEQEVLAEKTLSELILEQKTVDEEQTRREREAKLLGIAPMSYEQAQKEIEEGKLVFERLREKNEVEEKDYSNVKGVTPIEKIPPFTGKMRPVRPYLDKQIPKPKVKDPERLHKKFPDLYFERMYLEVNDPANAAAAPSAPETPQTDYFMENKRYLDELESKAKQNKIDVSSCVYAGKLFNTYLVYERGDELYIIDQHAAHERLIFNRLTEQMRAKSAVEQQPMLMPFEIKVNAFEGDFLRERLGDIRAMGFDIAETEENLFKIYAVPLDLQYIDLGKFMNDILGEINGYRAIKLEELLKDKLATAACKAAVKGGMDLTRGEIDELFLLMDGDMGLKCPHGRPVVVKMTKTQLEKMFKRIV